MALHIYVPNTGIHKITSDIPGRKTGKPQQNGAE